jgi:hypothetical protein
MNILAALIELPGAAWPAVFGTMVALVAWLEFRH